MSQTTASGNAIEEFEKVAVQCSLMEATAVIKFDDGKILEVTACKEPDTGYRKFFVREPEGHITERFHSLSLVEVVKEAGKKFGHGTLLVPQIRVVTSKSPVAKNVLRMLAVAAFCQAFGVPTPTEKELKEFDKASKDSTDQAKKALIDLLLGDKEGVEKWNKLTPTERTRFSPFKKTDLKGQNLEGVSFIGTYKTTLDMQSSCFDDAKIAGAQIEFCDLSKSSFKNADCNSIDSNGGRGKLSDCDFTGANLTDADLRYTNLNRGIFENAILKNAMLCDADLKGASFANAELSNAHFWRADIRGADFSSMKFDSDTTFDEAEYDENTRFPENFVGDGKRMKWKGTGRDPLQAERAKVASTMAGDFDSFMEQLKKDIDKSRLDKALKMLKAERFQLFAEVSDHDLVGVVKSQTDPDLVYACRLTSDGDFSCCTQNLYACGGLRGALCKHLLVLLIGLTYANEINSTSAYEWAMSSGTRKPKLIEDKMSETFLRYKGAEAGEIDWRPTETTPEDFYAF